MMKHATRIRIAALSTALFLGGITAGGLGIRALDKTNATPDPIQPARTQVIHQTKVRTVHVKPKKQKVAAPPPAAPATQPVVAQSSPQTQPAVQQAPSKVQSRTSPTGGGGGGEGEGSDHEGGGDGGGGD